MNSNKVPCNALIYLITGMSAAQDFWYHLKINYKGCNQQKAKFHKPLELLLKLPIFLKKMHLKSMHFQLFGLYKDKISIWVSWEMSQKYKQASGFLKPSYLLILLLGSDQ